VLRSQIKHQLDAFDQFFGILLPDHALWRQIGFLSIDLI
jgi:hypothetical protein